MSHYEVLGVRQSATIDEINTAFRNILQANHPDRTRDQGTHAQNKADKNVRAANAAWTVLSNVFSCRTYNDSLAANDPHVEHPSGTSASFDDSATKPTNGSSWRPSSFTEARDAGSKNDAESTESEHEGQEAEYRTLKTSRSTIMGIKISEWRLSVEISSKFTS